MTKPMNPLLKAENRNQFIKKAMEAMSDRQDKIIKQADKIIEDVALFENSVHKQFILHTKKH